MTDTPAHQMEALAEKIEASLTGTQATVTGFPSGGAMLDVRRDDGRTFVMAYTPTYGFGVDEIHEDEGFTTSYRFTYPDFNPAAERLRELVHNGARHGAPCSDLELKLFVLYARDLEAVREFYTRLGCRFQEERHGSGPLHYSTALGATVLELYPCDNRLEGRTRLGFGVSSIDDTLRLLREQKAKIVSEPRASRWGRRAVVEDPAGNLVELIEKKR